MQRCFVEFSIYALQVLGRRGLTKLDGERCIKDYDYRKITADGDIEYRMTLPNGMKMVLFYDPNIGRVVTARIEDKL